MISSELNGQKFSLHGSDREGWDRRTWVDKRVSWFDP